VGRLFGDLALAHGPVAARQPRDRRELRGAAELCCDARELLDERGEALARGHAGACQQIGQLGVHARARGRPAVLLQPPRVGDLELLAGVVARCEPGGQRVHERHHGRGVGDRRLRVRNAQLERAEGGMRPQLPPPAARVGHGARGGAPCERVGERLP
jgi:hypothetical protein